MKRSTPPPAAAGTEADTATTNSVVAGSDTSTPPPVAEVEKNPPKRIERKRLVLHKGEDAAAVVFPSSRDPGVVAFGDLKPDVEYVVSLDEARRLTSPERSHRFDYVTPEDAARAALPAETDTTTPQE